ncbi:hypothetical protein C0J52_15430 [Blattella germanica]|nr:hypothetical protein C0J52_15430 [Blattella germanica]
MKLDRLTVAAFADDLVIIGKSMEAAKELVMMVESSLKTIGLHLNVQKFALIHINWWIKTVRLIVTRNMRVWCMCSYHFVDDLETSEAEDQFQHIKQFTHSVQQQSAKQDVSEEDNVISQ